MRENKEMDVTAHARFILRDIKGYYGNDSWAWEGEESENNNHPFFFSLFPPFFIFFVSYHTHVLKTLMETDGRIKNVSARK